MCGSKRQYRRWPRVLRGLEFGLLVVGIVLSGAYTKRRIFASLESRQALGKFAVGRGQDPRRSGLIGRVDDSLWSPGRRRAYEDSRRNYEIASPIGVLKIPKIHLEVPLFNGTEDASLDPGVGRILGTSWPGRGGNIGIAGHRDGFFRRLKDIELGDRVELMSEESAQTFVVDRVEIVDPSNVEVLQPSSTPTITLVTCYPFYFVGHAPKRYIVEGRLSNQVPVSNKRNQGSVNP